MYNYLEISRPPAGMRSKHIPVVKSGLKQGCRRMKDKLWWYLEHHFLMEEMIEQDMKRIMSGLPEALHERQTQMAGGEVDSVGTLPADGGATV